jgi:hypothetical protein
VTREPQDEQQQDDDISLSPNRMVALPSVSGHAAVFIAGSYPGFILKTAHSITRFHKFVGESVRSMCQFNVTHGVNDGFLYYDSTVIPLLDVAKYRVLLGSVHCPQNSHIMANGLFDAFNKRKISAT